METRIFWKASRKGIVSAEVILAREDQVLLRPLVVGAQR